MKTTVFILLFVLVSAITFAGKPITGTSNTRLGNYVVTPMGDNMYQLSYSNGDANFTIEVCKDLDKKHCCYLLRGDHIEVMYQCNELGFGMRKMPDNKKKLETSEYKHLIDAETFSQQSLLSPNRKSETDALALIACFFPLVIKDNSYDLVFNTNNNKEKDKLTIR